MNQPEAATIWATVENSSHPEYGVVMIPFPIPREMYNSYLEKLRAMKIGDPLKQDCRVVSVLSDYSVLKPLEIMTVNVDELDYLAKRLESFDVGEAAQFQAMAHKLELSELNDLINLTFCCQQATVISDFSDLDAVGREHYLNLHGGCAPTKELEALNGAETAMQLIDSGKGVITPYGVVFDNGMKLEQHYDGIHFPAYNYAYKQARAYLYGTKEEKPDFQKAMPLLLTEANRGNGYACYDLGRMHQQGLGCEENEEEAQRWFSMALKAFLDAEQTAKKPGYLRYRIGKCYACGHGTEQNYEESARWFQRAVEENNPFAAYSLGGQYLRGQGVEQSDTEAYSLFTMAANHGNVYAQYQLGRMYKDGIGTKVDLEESKLWYAKAYPSCHY